MSRPLVFSTNFWVTNGCLIESAALFRGFTNNRGPSVGDPSNRRSVRSPRLRKARSEGGAGRTPLQPCDRLPHEFGWHQFGRRAPQCRRALRPRDAIDVLRYSGRVAEIGSFPTLRDHWRLMPRTALVPPACRGGLRAAALAEPRMFRSTMRQPSARRSEPTRRSGKHAKFRCEPPQRSSTLTCPGTCPTPPPSGLQGLFRGRRRASPNSHRRRAVSALAKRSRKTSSS
jgi:hypothetical protein